MKENQNLQRTEDRVHLEISGNSVAGMNRTALQVDGRKSGSISRRRTVGSVKAGELVASLEMEKIPRHILRYLFETRFAARKLLKGSKFVAFCEELQGSGRC